MKVQVRPAVTAHLLLRSALCAFLLALIVAVVVPSAVARNAYVTNNGSNTVSVFNTANNQIVGPAIPVGLAPDGIAIRPDGDRAYVADRDAGTVTVINTTTNTQVGLPIDMQTEPIDIAITPDGTRGYVTNRQSDNVVVFDTETNQPIGTPIAVGDQPIGIATTPDGSRVYVSHVTSSDVRVISTATNQVVGSPIALPGAGELRGMGITPDGTRLYVLDPSNEQVWVINTATNQTVGSPIQVGGRPFNLAITPDGARVYVGNFSGSDETVSVIHTAINQAVGPMIPVASQPYGLATTPNGARVYVTNFGGLENSVQAISTATNQVTGPAIPVGSSPTRLAIVPNQGPVASLAGPSSADSGTPVSFDASESSDPDGTIARYDWDFGDGTVLPDGGPNPTHVFRGAASHTVTVRVTDNEGCSDEVVFTGQTAHCNGGPQAVASLPVEVVGTALASGLSIQRAYFDRGRLSIRGSLDRAAAGEAVIMALRTRGGQVRMRTRVRPNGRFGLNAFLRGRHRLARVGLLAVHFRGNVRLRAGRARVRLAPRPAALRLAQPLTRGDRMLIHGFLRPGARGAVALLIEFNRDDGSPAQGIVRTRPSRRGRFVQRLRTPAAESPTTRVTAIYPGHGPFFGQAMGRALSP